jgi:hypothetical protein
MIDIGNWINIDYLFTASSFSYVNYTCEGERKRLLVLISILYQQELTYTPTQQYPIG